MSPFAAGIRYGDLSWNLKRVSCTSASHMSYRIQRRLSGPTKECQISFGDIDTERRDRSVGTSRDSLSLISFRTEQTRLWHQNVDIIDASGFYHCCITRAGQSATRVTIHSEDDVDHLQPDDCAYHYYAILRALTACSNAGARSQCRPSTSRDLNTQNMLTDTLPLPLEMDSHWTAVVEGFSTESVENFIVINDSDFISFFFAPNQMQHSDRQQSGR